ncbi:MAG TPA: gliding motility-associated C-terminal domain-containing protein [Cyclobacteriaceae bacterium]|nr:gliding motility-associated C-terminal domain-containing protein [Cyclobacteriaceae bacterium]
MRIKHLLFFLLIAPGFGEVFAQVFVNNGAVVSISEGTILSIPDSMVNKGTLINNGQVIIYGAWINTGTYDPGIGQVNFDSDLDQVINHNAQSIERLVISGGGQKEFLADIFVKSELTLQDGVLVSKNGARIVMDNAVTVVGGSDASHINGPVERKGTGDWLFPVGNGTKYLPVVIPGVTAASSFGILTLHELASGEKLTGEIDVEKLSTQRYWELVSGGDPLDETVITLPVVNEDDLGPGQESIIVAASTVPSGPYANISTTSFSGNLSSGSVTSDGHPIFKYYTVAKELTERDIEVFNAVSAGSDGKNDFMTIKNIEFYPENRVTIHNRWGDLVFQVSGYDNAQNVFRGLSDNGNKLPAGTYFYAIDLGNSAKKITGYVAVK